MDSLLARPGEGSGRFLYHRVMAHAYICNPVFVSLNVSSLARKANSPWHPPSFCYVVGSAVVDERFDRVQPRGELFDQTMGRILL